MQTAERAGGHLADAPHRREMRVEFPLTAISRGQLSSCLVAGEALPLDQNGLPQAPGRDV